MCSCGNICRAPCFSLRAARSSHFPSRCRHHPRPVSLDPLAGQGARGHRRPPDDRARLSPRRPTPARSSRSSSRPTIARIADAVRAFGGEVQMTSAAHQSGTDRLAEVAASLDLRPDRQRPGRRAADRAGDDRRSGRAVRRRSRARDEHAAQADRRPRPIGTIRTSPRSSSTRTASRCTFPAPPIPFTRDGCPPAPAWRHIGLYVYRARHAAAARRAAAGRDRTRRGARAAARAGPRHRDSSASKPPGTRSASTRRQISSTCGRWSPRTRS